MMCDRFDRLYGNTRARTHTNTLSHTHAHTHTHSPSGRTAQRDAPLEMKFDLSVVVDDQARKCLLKMHLARRLESLKTPF